MTISNISFDETQLAKICSDNGVQYLAIFGSVARGQNRPDSDIDLLARFNQPKSLFELIDLEDQLSQVFDGKKTDLVTEGFLSPFIKDTVKRDLRVIYGS